MKITLSDKPVTKAALQRLHDNVAAIPEQVELPVIHHHVSAVPNSPQGGVYARELFIPAGTLVVGKVHKYTQINIMSKGDMTIATEDGVFRVQAPYTVVSPPGVKRAVYAHEDTVWTTIHGTDEKDPEAIEKMFVCDNYDSYLEFAEQQLLENLERE